MFTFTESNTISLDIFISGVTKVLGQIENFFGRWQLIYHILNCSSKDSFFV